MRIVSASHNHGEVIVRHGFPHEWESLLSALRSIDVPLRPLKPFSASSRPKEPKRHERTIEGRKLPFLLPVDQGALNKAIELALRSDGWDTQPVAAGDFATGATPLSLKGDFHRNGVFVEVEFGNVASMHRDFFKFQVANRANANSVGVLVVATELLAKYFDSGVTTFEAAQRHIPYLAMGVQMPIWIVGVEPSDLGPIASRYREMGKLCDENNVTYHPFEITMQYAIHDDEEAYDP